MTEKSAKLVAVYSQPENPAEFDKKYFGEHVPLVEKMPGLKNVSVVKLQKNLMGADVPYYMIAELAFDDVNALKAALASPEGKAAGANIMGFAGKYVQMFIAEECAGETAGVR